MGCGSAKFSFWTDLEALNFVFCDFLHFFKADIHQTNKILAITLAKIAVSEVPLSPKLISRKI